MENTIQPPPVESALQGPPLEEAFKSSGPVISGFWRRLAAFLIDSLILGVAGMIVGFLVYDFLASLGGYGRVLGFTVALMYFGFMNSSLCGGKTVGKRLLGIKVVDKNKKGISLGRSFCRYTILGLPFFLNGAMLPSELTYNSVARLLIGLIVFFGGGAIIYLIIFNRKTRQSLHDLIMGTYVVLSESNTEISARTVWKGHWVALGVLFAAIFYLNFGLVPKLAEMPLFADMIAVQKMIENSGLTHSSSVVTGSSTSWSSNEGDRKTQYLSINAVLNRRPGDYEAAAKEIAEIIINNHPKINDMDIIAIGVSYGFDIGIAKGWRRYNYRYPPQVWMEKLQPLGKIWPE